MTLREKLNLEEGDVIIANSLYDHSTYEIKVMNFSSIPSRCSYLSGLEEVYVYGQILDSGKYDGFPLDDGRWTFVKKLSKIIEQSGIKGNSICPVCGSDGDDLIFAFYCSNKNCQNYKG